MVTKGGLVFIAATKDAKIRAFDKKTGKVLWEAQLPVHMLLLQSILSMADST
ncbi:PQQ-binding-like beta-propeller repeat protein [Rhodocytophaga rosea]|uniref:PQQ-binding-like beta-propeller repeat protein n=1 Tax=Rhodocytophaga rosea TaxID=2704465 RepID=A0A6C0GBR9_9BACT|nr:PQQ-binding-like beta-propeller repeat protein [Rhodocytophaga rosea]